MAFNVAYIFWITRRKAIPVSRVFEVRSNAQSVQGAIQERRTGRMGEGGGHARDAGPGWGRTLGKVWLRDREYENFCDDAFAPLRLPGIWPKSDEVGVSTPVEEREIYLQVPHFLVETLPPLQAVWKGRPQCVCCFSASVQVSLFGLPQGKSPGPHMKDQESNPRPHTCGTTGLAIASQESSGMGMRGFKGWEREGGAPIGQHSLLSQEL